MLTLRLFKWTDCLVLSSWSTAPWPWLNCLSSRDVLESVYTFLLFTNVSAPSSTMWRMVNLALEPFYLNSSLTTLPFDVLRVPSADEHCVLTHGVSSVAFPPSSMFILWSLHPQSENVPCRYFMGFRSINCGSLHRHVIRARSRKLETQKEEKLFIIFHCAAQQLLNKQQPSCDECSTIARG